MILHFHTSEALPGESAYLNINFTKENYNFNIYTDPWIHYIEVSREDLDRIYKEMDFNMYWNMDNLEAEHDPTVFETEPWH